MEVFMLQALQLKLGNPTSSGRFNLFAGSPPISMAAPLITVLSYKPHLPELAALGRRQLARISHLHNLPFLHYYHPVVVQHSIKPVRNAHNRAVGELAANYILHELIRLAIDARVELIEKENASLPLRCVLHGPVFHLPPPQHGSRKTEQLLLPLAERLRFQLGVQPASPLDRFPETHGLQSINAVVISNRDIFGMNVRVEAIPHRDALVQDEGLLWEGNDALTKEGGRNGFQRNVVDRKSAVGVRGGIEETM